VTWVDPLVVALLVLVNGLYVAAEFGAVGVRRSRIRELADDGDLLSLQLLPVLEDGRLLDRYIAGCQIGITLSSLVLGAYGQAGIAIRLAPAVGDWASLQPIAAQSATSAGVLIFLTILQVVFGELVPKSIALQFPTAAARYTSIPMRISLRLFAWFIVVLNGSGLLVLRALRLPHAGPRHIHSPEELDLLIAESRDGGLLEPEEQRRLHKALRLGLLPARQLMVPRPQIAALEIGTPIDRVLDAVARSPYTRLPVYRGSIDNIVGLLHTREVVLGFVEQGRALRIDPLLRPMPLVHENMSGEGLMRVLREGPAHMAVVVDEYGGVAGLVTLQDVVAELIGDVADEFKTAPAQPERLNDGRVRLPGRTRLDEAERWIGVLWHGGADTVGGHVTDMLGRLPVAGERLSVEGVEVEVERASPRAVISLIVTPRQPGVETTRG
jgi:putative hemolysin